jgi:hypothetical protein
MKSGKKCGGCGNGYRTSVLAYVPKDGRLVRTRVCPKCAKGAARLVLVGATTTCACHKPATLCAGCAERSAKRAADAAADIKPRAKALLLRAKLYQAQAGEYSAGLAAGLDMAGYYLTSGAWREEKAR